MQELEWVATRNQPPSHKQTQADTPRARTQSHAKKIVASSRSVIRRSLLSNHVMGRCLISSRSHDGIGHQLQAKLSCLAASFALAGVEYAEHPIIAAQYVSWCDGIILYIYMRTHAPRSRAPIFIAPSRLRFAKVQAARVHLGILSCQRDAAAIERGDQRANCEVLSPCVELPSEPIASSCGWWRVRRHRAGKRAASSKRWDQQRE